MAKKRKTRASEPAQPQIKEEIPSAEPKPVPEPVQEPEPETEPVQEPEVPVEEAIEEEQVEEIEEIEEIEEVEEEEENSDGEENNEGSEEENQTVTENKMVNGEDSLAIMEEDDEPIENLLEPFSKEQLVTLLKEAVGKHPDLKESVSKVADADPAHRKIFVHGLGWDTTTDTLKSVFEKYGEIEDCRAVTDKVSGKSKGYGFILYKHRSGSRKALQEPQKQIGNRMTSCQLASTGPAPAPPPTAAPSASEYSQKKIYVSNVGAEIDPQKLLEFFAKWGEIEEGPLGLDKQTGKPRGFCFFVYKSVESARKALEEPHKSFGGHTLHCQKAVDGLKQGKNFSQHGGNAAQQPHHQQQQQYYGHQAKKGKYSGGGGGGGGGGGSTGHLMAPGGGPVGYNPAMAAGPALNPALGQALTALLATQGAGLGIGNFLPQGVQPMMNNPGYGGPVAGGYGGQVGYQNPQVGSHGGARPHQGGGYLGGHGR